MTTNPAALRPNPSTTPGRRPSPLNMPQQRPGSSRPAHTSASLPNPALRVNAAEWLRLNGLPADPADADLADLVFGPLDPNPADEPEIPTWHRPSRTGSGLGDHSEDDFRDPVAPGMYVVYV